MDHFSEMITHKYSLFDVVEGGGVDIPTLTETLKSLDTSSGESLGSVGEVWCIGSFFSLLSAMVA